MYLFVCCPGNKLENYTLSPGLWLTDRVTILGPIYKISYDLSYDYRKFIVRSTYDSDLTCAEISLREYRKLIYDTIFYDITILHMNLTYEKLSIHCNMFCKLDVRRMLIVTLALS